MATEIPAVRKPYAIEVRTLCCVVAAAACDEVLGEGRAVQLFVPERLHAAVCGGHAAEPGVCVHVGSVGEAAQAQCCMTGLR